tara:strand:+ start:5274 stop:5921 length:648 start_codon:yes stop_codon:yes gene_type:complete
MNTFRFSKLIRASYLLKAKITSNSAFTIVELVFVVAIVGVLATIAVPSSLKWVYSEKQNSYIRELTSYLELMRKEARRWNGSCSFTPKTISFNNPEPQKLFLVSCKGMNNNQRMNLINSVPLANKNIFQEVNSSLHVTPKGQIALPSSSNSNSVIIVIGGRYNSNPASIKPKCIKIDSPSGIIRSGIYQQEYRYSENRKNSKYNYGLRDIYCLTR